MKKASPLCAIVVLMALAVSCADAHIKFARMSDKAFENAIEQYAPLADSMMANRPGRLPHSIKPDGTLADVPPISWVSGFFPGSLWYIYEYTGNEAFKAYAEHFTHYLKKIQYVTKTHDLGFMMYCSYGNAYRLTGKEEYKDVVVTSAKSLSTRFDPVVGCIKSWEPRVGCNGVDQWDFPVIIDNMMNLELLFEATRLSGDSTFHKMAVSHANNTMKNHIRHDDYSTYHVVNYNPETGAVEHQRTQQGFADNSTWSRGQAWAIYGFTLCYRYTKDEAYLEIANKLADFVIDNPRLPEDAIPVWDYNVGEEGFVPVKEYTPEQIAQKPRDASAAAVMASGMLELATYSNEEQSTRLVATAEKMLCSLSSKNYTAKVGENKRMLLMHSVTAFPIGREIDVPLSYADYYYLEALLRWNKIFGTK